MTDSNSTFATPLTSEKSASLNPSFAPVLPPEGWHVLHSFFRLNPVKLADLPQEVLAEEKSQFLNLVKEIRSRPQTQLLLFSTVSQKADWGFILLTDDLHFLDIAGKKLARSLGTGVNESVLSYFSITERSEYTTSDEEYAKSLEEEENILPGSEEMAEKVAAFRIRMDKYGKHRLYPTLPDWPVICFYPMSKRRNVGQNWYGLSYEERKELMKGHAQVGRKYSGRVLQLITGSTGLDLQEWGVTLFAHTPAECKAIVAEMRFDAVSVHYAEFGDFYIGLQLGAEDLLIRLGL